jgi:hypothetical protein
MYCRASMKIRNKQILLLLILLLGTVLRVYHLRDIPFIQDELSVVFRTGYSSFSELISKGIMPDVHPAGIQVFMNYWVALFGTGEPAVKLPFILFGIISIFLVYKIGRDWFGEDAGLLSAAFVTAMEYMVMHSQTARPYASGLMFSLLMVYAWQRYLFRPGRSPAAWLVTWVLASAACVYNHYFSMLFAGLVGVTGLLFIRRRQALPYLLGCASVILLFSPNLRIFFFQFRERGVEGWLAKPRNGFILDYLGYVFHYSPFILVIVAGIVLAGILSGQTRKLLGNRYFYISLAWFFIPFMTGFFYSRYVNAVLQFRVLIFYFPFLLFLFTGNLPELKSPARTILILLTCTVFTLSLVFERQYYHLFYRSRFKEIILETDRSLKEHGVDNCLAIMDSHERISEYYYNRLDIHYDHYNYDDFASKTDFINLLQSGSEEYLSLGVDSQTEFVLPRIIMDYYPFLNKKIDYQGGNYYLFSKYDTVPPASRLFSLNGFDGSAPGWYPGNDSMYADTAGHSLGSSYFMDQGNEYGPVFSASLADLAADENDLIDVSVSVLNLDPLNNSILVLSLEGKKGVVEWTASPFTDYDPGTGEWYTVYHTFRPGRFFHKGFLHGKNPVLKIYVWNHGKNNFLMDDFRIMARPGNPVLYGLTEKI